MATSSSSAKKRHRQSEKRKIRNKTTKGMLKTHVKRTRTAAGEGNKELAETEFRLTVKKLDQAASRGVIHKNKASRLKSRLAAVKKKGLVAPAAV